MMRLDVLARYQFVSLSKESHSVRGLSVFLPLHRSCPPYYSHAPKTKTILIVPMLFMKKSSILTNF